MAIYVQFTDYGPSKALKYAQRAESLGLYLSYYNSGARRNIWNGYRLHQGTQHQDFFADPHIAHCADLKQVGCFLDGYTANPTAAAPLSSPSQSVAVEATEIREIRKELFELNQAGRQGDRTDDLYFERERAEADALYNLAERLGRATPDQLEQLRIDAQTLMGAIAEPSE